MSDTKSDLPLTTRNVSRAILRLMRRKLTKKVRPDPQQTRSRTKVKLWWAKSTNKQLDTLVEHSGASLDKLTALVHDGKF